MVVVGPSHWARAVVAATRAGRRYFVKAIVIPSLATNKGSEMQLKVDECFDDLDIGESKVKRSVSRLKLIHRDAESGRTN
jgi:hypothetical protein